MKPKCNGMLTSFVRYSHSLNVIFYVLYWNEFKKLNINPSCLFFIKKNSYENTGKFYFVIYNNELSAILINSYTFFLIKIEGQRLLHVL